MASTQLPVSYDDVVAARTLIQDVVRRTPLESSRPLSDLVGGPVLLKCENLQRAGSFKVRGAYTGSRGSATTNGAGAWSRRAPATTRRASPLPPDARHQGHGLHAGRRAAAQAEATRGYGAEVERRPAVDESLVAAHEFAADTGAVLIPPFDHPDIIAGQGTLGLEILEQCPTSARSSRAWAAAA